MFDEQGRAEVVARRNLQAALQQVRANPGSPGTDGMRVDELPDLLKARWPEIKAQLLHGPYQPMESRRVAIPQPGSQEHSQRGMPGVRDRLIPPAMLQGLQGCGAPTFAAFRSGFRPGRRARQAVAQAPAYMEQGSDVVVAMEREKCFAHVGHDRLMSRLAERIAAKRLRKLLRADVPAGILDEGWVLVPEAGTPPGAPLSPFRSHGVLDAVDKELEARGHCVCRSAAESHISVRSIRAGERVMVSRKRFIPGRLQVKVQESKRAVDRPQHRSFLGFSFTGGHSAQRRKMAPTARARFQTRVTTLPRRTQGRSLGQGIATLNQYLRGWVGFFGCCQTAQVLRDVDSWIRHRRRGLQWKQWQGDRRRKAEWIKRGSKPELAPPTAFSATGPWRISHTPGVRLARNNPFFARMRLIRLRAHHRM